MNEIVKNYIGKYCTIYTIDNQVHGTIQSVEGDWIVIKIGERLDLINMDYVIRIRDFSKNKNQ